MGASFVWLCEKDGRRSRGGRLQHGPSAGISRAALPVRQGDSDHVFCGVTAAEMIVTTVMGARAERAPAAAGKLAEQRPGGVVVGGDRGLQPLDPVTGAARHQLLQQAAPQPKAPRLRRYRDLPDKHRLWVVRQKIGRHPTDDLPVPLGHDASLSKVVGLQEVAVH